MLRPSVLAVCRLMMNSNLVARQQVSRVLAFEDAAGIDAALAIPVRSARSVAHQPADFDMVAEGIDCGQPVVRSQRDELDATVVQQRVGTDQECVRPFLHQAGKGGVKLKIGAGIEAFDFSEMPERKR